MEIPKYIIVIFFIYFFMMAACIGSFINVVTDRAVSGKKLGIKDRSHCCSCGHVLGFLDLIPVFSFIFIGGKCRYCKAKLEYQYLVVEVLFGLAGVGAVLLKGFNLDALLLFVLFVALYVVTYVDIKIQEIPMWCNILIFGLALINCFILKNTTVLEMVIGAVCVSGLLFLIAVIKSGSFGFGDIKLFMSAGALLGWKYILVAFLVSLVACTIQIIICKSKAKQVIPYGPAIAIGIMISSLFGQYLLTWYLQAAHLV